MPQSKLNPTEYDFPVSKQSLFDSLYYGKAKCYYKYFSARFRFDTFTLKGDTIMFAYICEYRHQKEFKDYDGSFVYRKGDRGKMCDLKFGLVIDSLATDSCRVRIIYMGGVLLTRKFQLAEYSLYREKPISSTTIEEYLQLRLIGKRLGILDQMPLVDFPDELSRMQILKTYSRWQEFTYEEMFGEPEPANSFIFPRLSKRNG